MDDDENQARNSFLTLYVQKQEQLLLDYLRKSIESEIKVVALTSSLQDITSQYEESQKQVELQNDMMQQAAKGLEVTTLEKKQLEEKEKELSNRITELTNNYETRLKDNQTNYEARIRDLETNLGVTREELNKIKQNDEGCNKKLEDLRREYDHQKEELNNIYKENQELKSKLPPETKAVKKQIKKPVLLLDDNEF